MRVLHDFPIIPDTLHVGDNNANPLILDPSLVGEFEQVKVTFQPTSIEDFSKIWTALPEANFRRSVTYQVSVVQIESRRAKRSALPVRERRVYAVPLATPRIVEIVRDPPFDNVRNAVAEAGDPILVIGENLRGDATRVRIGSTSIVVPAPQPTQIALTLPANLEPGAQTVQVVHDLRLDAQPGQPPVPHRGFESNVAVLLVVPHVVAFAPLSAGAGATITVTLTAPVRAAQERTLLLGDVSIPGVEVPAASPPSAAVSFQLPSGPAALAPGSYLARVRIDGAESRLTRNAVTGLYDGPTFMVV